MLSRKGKSPALILSVLVCLTVAAAGAYFFQKEHARALELQAKLEDVATKLKVTQMELDGSRNKVAAAEAKLQEAQAQVDSLNVNLEQEKTAKAEAVSLGEQLKADLQQQQALRTDLENKLNRAQAELKKLEAQLKELNVQKTDLQTQVEETSAQAGTEGVELGRIVVSPAEATAEAVASSETKGLQGEILVVNKDYDFAVINLGSKDGVNAADTFAVYHKNRYLGDIQIEKIHDFMSAAGFLSPEMKNKVSEGDKVMQKI